MSTNGYTVVALCLVGLFLNGCSDEPRITKEMLASSPNYPEWLEYNPESKDYIGSPELELMPESDEKIELKNVEFPILTFDSAFKVACDFLVENYGEKTISNELPLLMDFRDNVWIVQGAFPSSDDPDVIILGGVAHLAFDGKTGRVLYLWHSL